MVLGSWSHEQDLSNVLCWAGCQWDNGSLWVDRMYGRYTETVHVWYIKMTLTAKHTRNQKVIRNTENYLISSLYLYFYLSVIHYVQCVVQSGVSMRQWFFMGWQNLWNVHGNCTCVVYEDDTHSQAQEEPKSD